VGTARIQVNVWRANEKGFGYHHPDTPGTANYENSLGSGLGDGKGGMQQHFPAEENGIYHCSHTYGYSGG
jgi:hypothetical protein